MKFLVIATLVACAFAKPTEKPLGKRQLEQFPFGAQSFQNINQFVGSRALPTQFGIETQSAKSPSLFLSQNSDESLRLNDALSSNGALFDQTLSERFGSVNNVQPIITNIGNTGLNSRSFSTTTAAPSSISLDSFNIPTSTVSPLFNPEVSSISPVSSGASFASLSSLGSSEILPQGFSSTPLPDISSTFSSSTFDSLNANPTAIPIASSSVVPSNLLQSRFGSNNLFLDNSNLQGLDLNSFNLNNYINAGSNFQSDSQLVGYSDKSPEITKSLYFYEAPEDLEPIRQRKIVQLPPQKTNYKILFIKAPAAPEPQPIEIPAQIQNNEKTRVYVLVKKPETEQEVRVVAAPTPKPERPEVFYIKYKTREEAEKAIKQAQEGAALGQESINVNGQQLVNAIQNAKLSHTGGSLIVKQTHPLPSVPLNLFESSTALPFISTTGAFDNFYGSSTASPLLNSGNFNQFSLYNTPVLSSVSNSFPTSGDFYSNGNNLFSTGNNGFSSGNIFSAGTLRSNNLGTIGGVNFSPNTFGSSSFSNTPTLIGYGPKLQLDSRLGRIDETEEKKVTTPTPPSDVPLETTPEVNVDVKDPEESNFSKNKDEPLLLSLVGVDSTTASSAFTNAVESSSTAEAEIDIPSSSSSDPVERK